MQINTSLSYNTQNISSIGEDIRENQVNSKLDTESDTKANQQIQNIFQQNILKIPPNLSRDFDIEKARQEHSYLKYSIPHFSGKIYYLKARNIEVCTQDSQIVRDFNTIFDPKQFLYPRMPVVVGSIEDKNSFDCWGAPRCIHLPIKMPGSDIRIPAEYLQFSEAIQKIMDHEFSTNPEYEKPYYYLTVDQGFIPQGQAQRIPFAHVDGLPRDRVNINQITDHAYLITNSISTKFYTHSFDLTKYDINKHNFFEIMNRTKDETQTTFSKPYEITLMGCYNVHTAIINTDEDVFRTFIRIEASTLEFDREGNSINPGFVGDANYNYPFQMRRRQIPDHLVVPDELKTAEELAEDKQEGPRLTFNQKWYDKNPVRKE